jgi:hypothetical protein
MKGSVEGWAFPDIETERERRETQTDGVRGGLLPPSICLCIKTIYIENDSRRGTLGDFFWNFFYYEVIAKQKKEKTLCNLPMRRMKNLHYYRKEELKTVLDTEAWPC